MACWCYYTLSQDSSGGIVESPCSSVSPFIHACGLSSHFLMLFGGRLGGGGAFILFFN